MHEVVAIDYFLYRGESSKAWQLLSFRPFFELPTFNFVARLIAPTFE